MSHITDRFADAVRILVGDGPIKQRLGHAYAEHLEGLDEADLPVALRGELLNLTAALNRVAPVGKETRVRASIQKMSPDEAGRYAETILKLYVGLAGPLERAEPLKVVGNPQKTPRYLTNRS